ncbi:MAG TPA: helix-turn-helix domain-containing protein [Methylomirabilota bacterium]|nr:helix-turn-helix domain-containing protein [Methylomirabilota bacterium]
MARDLLVASGMHSGHASLQEALSAFKRQLIVDALAMHDGNRSRAAAALGIERTSLLRLIRDLEIDVEPAPQLGRPRADVVPHES